MKFSGKQYVKAIIAYLKSKHRCGVSFELSSYDHTTIGDIPYCNALQYVVDTVSISDEKPGCVNVAVCREDGFMAYEVFDGSEDEDFEYLFSEIYYYINDAEDPEAEEWLENNIPVACPFCESENTAFFEGGYRCKDCESLFDKDDVEREAIRHAVSSLLISTDEEHPLEFEVPISQYGVVKDGFQFRDGTIWFHVDERKGLVNFDDFSITDLLNIYITLNIQSPSK